MSRGGVCRSELMREMTADAGASGFAEAGRGQLGLASLLGDAVEILT